MKQTVKGELNCKGRSSEGVGSYKREPRSLQRPDWNENLTAESPILRKGGTCSNVKGDNTCASLLVDEALPSDSSQGLADLSQDNNGFGGWFGTDGVDRVRSGWVRIGKSSQLLQLAVYERVAKFPPLADFVVCRRRPVDGDADHREKIVQKDKSPKEVDALPNKTRRKGGETESVERKSKTSKTSTASTFVFILSVFSPFIFLLFSFFLLPHRPLFLNVIRSVDSFHFSFSLFVRRQ